VRGNSGIQPLPGIVLLDNNGKGTIHGHAANTGIERGFAPIGMLENWNIGTMGFGRLACWVNGIIVRAIKLRWVISLDKPTIPSIQESIIP